MNEFKRKEVWLHYLVINRLQMLANKKGWSLKQYMETVLTKDSQKQLNSKTQTHDTT